MKRMSFVIIILLAFAGAASAQQDPCDPGIQDSIIVGQVIIDTSASFALVPIYAVTDDSVAFYTIPVGWFPRDVGVRAAERAWYFPPLTSWDDVFDSLMINEGYMRTVGWFDIYPETENIPLITNGQRVHIMTLRFIIEDNWEWQPIYIDSAYDDRNGSILFGLVHGMIEFHPAFLSGAILPITEIGDGILPISYSLEQNYPNPFNPSTTIEFSLPSTGHLSLEIYDILGRNVKTLIDNQAEAGRYSIIWDGKNNAGQDVPSGAYFYRLTGGDFSATRKMLLIR